MKKYLSILSFIMVSNVLFPQTKQEKLNDLLNYYLESNSFNGTALVYKNGETILQQGYGYRNYHEKTKNYSNTIFQLGSVTKQFTTAIILKLQEEGKLKVTDKLSKYFPTYPKGDSITIRHLLTHTSGIYNYTDDAAFMQNELATSASKGKMLLLFEHKPLDFSPGTKMKYCNSGYLLLGYIIEMVTNNTYEQVVRGWIFKPLGMNNSGFNFKGLQNINKAVGYQSMADNQWITSIMVDSTVSFAGGAIYSTVQDLLKWHLGLLNNKIIKRQSQEEAYTPFKNHFGYGWVVDTFDGKKAVFHNGFIPGFTSNVYRIEEDNTCIILLNNIPNQNIDTITKKLLAVLYDKDYNLPEKKREISVDKEVLNKYVGTYQFSPEFQMNIFLNANRIFAQRIGEENKFEIFPYKEDLFFLKAFDAELEFRENDLSIYDTLILRQGGKDMAAIRSVAKKNILYNTILEMDNLFSEAYNAANIEKLKSILSSELDFYHDLTGHTNYNQNIQTFKDNFNRAKKMRRELVKETLEVYPIKDFGALEIGTHNFYVKEEGQKERLESSPKFIHVWKYKDGKWEIVEVISYAH